MESGKLPEKTVVEDNPSKPVTDRSERERAISGDSTKIREESRPNCSTMITSNMEEMVEQLTDGFLSEVQPQLTEMREKTKEITKNQTILIETIQQENRKLAENIEMEEIMKLVSVVQSYHGKLKKIKSSMDQLEERLAKLKKRSFKLKERRERRDLDEAQRRERELALEQELTAKPAT